MIREIRTGAPVERAGLRGERSLLATCVLLVVVAVGVTVHMCNAMSGGMPMPGGWTLSMVWILSADQSWRGAAASFVAAWIVMMVAMMLPSFVPALASYRRGVPAASMSRSAALTMLVGIGYFATWAVVGAVVYPLGAGVTSAELRWPMLARSAPIAIAIVVLLAGCAQFSAWKSRQLRRCRDTSRCGQSLRFDARSALRHGARLGVHCALCCANFMIVLLVVGVMDLRTMAAVTIAITVERLALMAKQAAHEWLGELVGLATGAE
ncbi:MAG: DUF2182 domain-containing protein [Gemmatimonadaceae bacterium]